MTTDSNLPLLDALDAAKRFEGDYRAMRVTLECGHLRLMARINTIQGIGAMTACRVCPRENMTDAQRLVVNVEETGVLHDEWSRRVSKGLPVDRR